MAGDYISREAAMEDFESCNRGCGSFTRSRRATSQAMRRQLPLRRGAKGNRNTEARRQSAARCAASELGRNAFGFEIDRNFYREAKEKMLCGILAERQESENAEQTSLF